MEKERIIYTWEGKELLDYDVLPLRGEVVDSKTPIRCLGLGNERGRPAARPRAIVTDIQCGVNIGKDGPITYFIRIEMEPYE